MRIALSYRGLLMLIALAGLAVGAAFAGGISYGRDTAPETVVTVTSTGGGAAGAGAAAGQAATGQPVSGQAGGGTTAGRTGRPLAGTVKTVEGNLVTLSTDSGEAKVQLGETTAIRKVEAGSVVDISPGRSIVVQGQPNAEGTLVAASIEVALNPRATSP